MTSMNEKQNSAYFLLSCFPAHSSRSWVSHPRIWWVTWGLSCPLIHLATPSCLTCPQCWGLLGWLLERVGMAASRPVAHQVMHSQGSSAVLCDPHHHPLLTLSSQGYTSASESLLVHEGVVGSVWMKNW